MRHRHLRRHHRAQHNAAQARYDAATVADVKQFMSVLYMFLPIPIFWALFDQQSSRWVFQAERMNGKIGSYEFKQCPDVPRRVVINECIELAKAFGGTDGHKWVNGVLKQNDNTSDMAHKIPRSIEWMSQIHDLEPGDILATGTNHRGLSAFQDGDTVDLECEGMGKLTIKVRDDLKRTWARETRLEREQKGLKGTTPQLTGKYAKA